MSTTSSLARLQELLPQLFQSVEIKGDRYLRFEINKLSALIPMISIQESLLVSGEKITPIPKMPSSMIGIISSRDTVFCVFDLRQLMGLSSLSNYLRQYHIVVLKDSSELLIGIAVDKIQGVTRISQEEILDLFSTKNLFPMEKNYFQKFVKQKEQELLILDLPTLFSEIKQSH
ncbi:purine-binding chemotaxis protein [Geminocystis sp. NIES-3708]|uniref:chemotaxis protein CheW n=1 Tax=Geminocystis sp. NIES-3708 TaxID=1615909 RepID=UPI0005FC4A03|nr:chemotaxis protein CheW [Geminocystis sp. NIES-3708]BAQ61588.1 purine-binding chemotaxis protein [Geminocystis sp. NIES-3708]